MRILFVLLTYLFTETYSTPTPAPSPPKDVIVNVITRKWTHLLNDKFLSFTLQPHIALEFQDYSPATLNMFKGLSPGMLRLGGPETNHLTFLTPGNNSEYTIIEEQWRRINEFCQKTKLDLIVCVNPMERVHDVWQSRGALEFIYASDKLGYDLQWQLGYELQRLTNNSEPLSGSELGRDVVRMRKILDSFPRYAKSSIIGPDVISASTPQEIKFIKEYVNESGDALTALTWHPNFSAEEREMEDISRTLSQIQQQLENVIWARDLKSPFPKPINKKEVWISESNPDEYTGKFSDALTWTKRLGTAAMLGFPVLMKQITTNSVSQPTPDFWVSILYKSLVGRAVLETRLATGDKNTSHVYAHCTEMSPNNVIDGDIQYERGAVTVFGLNLANEEIKLNLKASFKDEPVHIYLLTAENKEHPEETYLNGQLLTLSPSGELPVLSPKVKNATRNVVIEIPARSVYFIVLPDIKVRPCTLYPSSQTNDTKSNAIQPGITSANSIDSSHNGEKEIYVRFGPKKKNKSSNSENISKNELTIEKLSKLNFPLPDIESGEEKELDRPAKSIKESSLEISGKNKLHKTPAKDNISKLSEKLRNLRKDGLKINKINENDANENNDKDKELTEAMLKTKFIMFSDDDWMSNFSHAKKAVEAAKKIIEAFDEAEMMKKKESSQQQSVLQVENDKYHIQYGKEALRKKKFAVLSASVLGKQNDTTNNNDNSSNENNNNPEAAAVHQEQFAASAEHKNNNSESVDNSSPTEIKIEPERQRRHTDNKISQYGNDMNLELLHGVDMMPHILIKRKQEQPYPNQNNHRNMKSEVSSENENTKNSIMKENIPSALFHAKESGNLNLNDFTSQHSSEESFPVGDVYLREFGSSAESNKKYEFKVDETKINDKDIFEKQEQESDNSNDQQTDNTDTYYPGEFYEHRMLKKVETGVNNSGYEDLSEAEVMEESDCEEIKPDKDAPNLSVVKSNCEDANYDKTLKENVEKQLNKYYENAQRKIDFHEELDENWNQDEDNANQNERASNDKIEVNREASSVFSEENEKRVKRRAEIEPKLKNRMNKRSEQNEKNSQSLGVTKVSSEKENNGHISEIRKNTSRNNRMPREEMKTVKKIGILSKKHVNKREAINKASEEKSIVHENLGTIPVDVKGSFDKDGHVENSGMTKKEVTKSDNEKTFLLSEQSVNDFSWEKGTKRDVESVSVKPAEIVSEKSTVKRSNFDLKHGIFDEKTKDFLQEFSDDKPKMSKKASEDFYVEHKNDMSEISKLTKQGPESEFKPQETAEVNIQNLRDEKNFQSTEGTQDVKKQEIIQETKENNTVFIDPPSNPGIETTAFNLSPTKQDIKESSQTPLISVSVIDGDQFSSSIISNDPKSDNLSNKEFLEEIRTHDVDIVCGRTKNFGTFCIGSERKIDENDDNLQNNESITDLATSATSNDNNLNLSEKSSSLPKDEHEQGQSNPAETNDSLINTEVKQNPSELKPAFVQRREISEGGEALKTSSILEKDIGQEYLEEGSPMCKASRSAPYVEDFEELLSQMHGLEKNSDKLRQRRLIRFTVPAVNIKKVSAEKSNSHNVDHPEEKDKENESKNESESTPVNNGDLSLQNHPDEKGDQPTNHFTKDEDNENNQGIFVKKNSNGKHDDQDPLIGRQIKRTVVPIRKESGRDVHYRVQHEGNIYPEEDEEELIVPEKMFMIPIRSFRNKGNMMMGDYFYDDESFVPKHHPKMGGEGDYDGEPDESNQFMQKTKSQQMKDAYQYPYLGSYRSTYKKNDEGPNRGHKQHEHASLPGDVAGELEEAQALKPNSKPHFIKSAPVPMMPVMLMSPDMFKPKSNSRTSSLRAKRSLVPQFHNFKNDIENMKNEMLQPQTSQSLNKARIYLRSPNIKKQYPLGSKVNNLINRDNQRTGNTNRIVKEVHYNKRSARDLSNRFTEKENSIKNLKEEKYTMNGLVKDVNKEVDDWKDEDAYDITLIRDKNKLINSLTNKLADLTKVYIKESANKNKVVSSNEVLSIQNNDSKEATKNDSGITGFSSVNDLKSSAEEEENKASESTEKIKNNITTNKVTPTGIPKIRKQLRNTSNSFQDSQNTFNIVVNQMKNLINFIVQSLTQIQ